MPQVLVVDDSPRTRTVLGMAFADAGYDVREAEDGVQALVELVQDAPDCMVLDLVMPRLCGLDVLRAMRAEGLAAETRVLVYSAEDGEGQVRRALDLGADDFVIKPIDPFALVGMVGDVLATAGTTPRQACGAVSADRRPPAEVTRAGLGGDQQGAGTGTGADVVDLGAYRAAYAAG
jgi:DNA-binding response OmpR family regulator